MTTFSHYPLQKSIYQALSADSALSALVNGVFDRPPQGTPFPYVTLGELAGENWSSKTTSGMSYAVGLHVWSREGGRKQAASAMERIHTLLHGADLSVEGQTLVMLRFTSSRIELENDGWTYHGTMLFRALVEATP